MRASILVAYLFLHAPADWSGPDTPQSLAPSSFVSNQRARSLSARGDGVGASRAKTNAMIAAMSTDSTIKKLLNLRLTKFEWVLSRPARLQSHARTAGHSGKDRTEYSRCGRQKETMKYEN